MSFEKCHHLNLWHKLFGGLSTWERYYLINLANKCIPTISWMQKIRAKPFWHNRLQWIWRLFRWFWFGKKLFYFYIFGAFLFLYIWCHKEKQWQNKIKNKHHVKQQTTHQFAVKRERVLFVLARCFIIIFPPFAFHFNHHFFRTSKFQRNSTVFVKFIKIKWKKRLKKCCSHSWIFLGKNSVQKQTYFEHNSKCPAVGLSFSVLFIIQSNKCRTDYYFKTKA